MTRFNLSWVFSVIWFFNEYSITFGQDDTIFDLGPYPLILVPGDGGSQVEAKLDKPSVVHYICGKKSDSFFDLWLNLELLAPLVIDCFIDNLRLIYDNKTRKTENSPGVYTRVPGFGNTSTVEFLDPSQVSPSRYFADIVDGVVKQGYNRGYDVKGAPYDFRKAPNEHELYFKNLQKLIEKTSIDLQAKVVITAHSMGAAFTLYFLNRMTQEWKNRYIKALITLAGCWAGTVKALKTFAMGDNLGVYFLNARTLRREQITSPSLAFLMPSSKLWSGDEILVSTPDHNYTVNDYEAFFNDMGYPEGWEMRKDTADLVHALKAPGVELHCIHGYNVSTIERIDYGRGEFPDKDGKLMMGDGDGTVNLRSLEACSRWATEQSQPVKHIKLENVDHMSIIHDPSVIEYIQKVLQAGSKLNQISVLQVGDPLVL